MSRRTQAQRSPMLVHLTRSRTLRARTRTSRRFLRSSEADLVSVLAGDGPLGLCANERCLPASGLDQAALDALSAEQAAQIITYHAVAGSVLSLVPLGRGGQHGRRALAGRRHRGVTLNGGNAVAGGANVSTADVTADNGVVHVIVVLLPPTVTDLARYAGLD